MKRDVTSKPELHAPVAKRDGISRPEMQELVAALKGGATWEQAKALLPSVDPIALDTNFKTWAHKQAGIELKTEKPKAKADPLE